MKCIIRDDDTCALTSPEELEKCYDFLPDNIPVCLSVTPFRIPGEYWDIQPEKRDIPFALEDNQELVSYLTEKASQGRVDIALHGYQHACTQIDTDDNIIEFPDYSDRSRPWWREFLYGNDLERRTRDGKRYLEVLLHHKISTFVPPGNAISRNGLQALINNELNLIGSPQIDMLGTKHRPFNWRNQFNALRRKAWKMSHKSRKYPFVMDFGTHKEIEYYLIYPHTSLRELKKEVDLVNSVDGTLIISTHYYAFDEKISTGETIREALQEILEYIDRKDNPRFITYNNLWRM